MSKKTSEMNDYEKEIYRLLAPLAYEKRLKDQEFAENSAGSYAKWLLSTLLIMNGGAFLGIASSGENAGKIYAISGLYFIGGLFLAFLSGLFVWWNWDMHAAHSRALANPNMVWGPDWDLAAERDGENSELFRKHEKRLSRTKTGAIVFGILSLLALLGGAISIWLYLQ
ncbi:MAG: hypothetical protein ABJE63_02915 [Lentilitoribacter sp.]